MYDFELGKNEKIILINDDVIVGSENKKYTIIVTNKRLLVLDYPSKFHNSIEDLRAIGRINTVKMKEVICEKKLIDIKNINNKQIIFDDDSYIVINDKEIINLLKNERNM